jgi:photosystem I subunit 3
MPGLDFPGLGGGVSEVLIPGVIFLYVAGWIGWSSREYISEISGTRTYMEACDAEIIIDVPLALSKMAGGYSWPLALWTELLS